MPASKFSQEERLRRKREAARLRQRRCRAKKKQRELELKELELKSQKPLANKRLKTSTAPLTKQGRVSKTSAPSSSLFPASAGAASSSSKKDRNERSVTHQNCRPTKDTPTKGTILTSYPQTVIANEFTSPRKGHGSTLPNVVTPTNVNMTFPAMPPLPSVTLPSEASDDKQASTPPSAVVDKEELHAVGAMLSLRHQSPVLPREIESPKKIIESACLPNLPWQSTFKSPPAVRSYVPLMPKIATKRDLDECAMNTYPVQLAHRSQDSSYQVGFPTDKDDMMNRGRNLRAGVYFYYN
ncbi:predicted protein [Chaetoceros tenuissimus]|uniref:Uncharacterized protein n=1 Tax=Chaetoceros tenuissimus TaxID=426638 RepID=A0AAD3CKE7_9STRA|nr:predicted protein [Chaetoceros tenuissimus]